MKPKPHHRRAATKAKSRGLGIPKPDLLTPLLFGAGAKIVGDLFGRVMNPPEISIEIESKQARETVSLKLPGLKILIRPQSNRELNDEKKTDKAPPSAGAKA